MADLDGDTLPDLVTSDRGGLSVQLGNGDGTFGAADSYTAGVDAKSVAVVDLDGDAFLDLISANRGGATVLINLPEPSQLPGIAAGLAVLLWLRWRSEKRVSKEGRLMSAGPCGNGGL